MLLSGKRRFYKILFGYLFVLLMGTKCVYAESNNIDALRVAYLYNIAKFTRWPETTWTDKTVPFQLCFYGENNVKQALLTLQGKEVNGHPINVVKPNQQQDFQQCHAFYIDTANSKRYRYLLSLINRQNVLVITNDSPFFNTGGLVNLVEFNHRLRFQVSMKELEQSQLKLSSKLLQMAILVENSK